MAKDTSWLSKLKHQLSLKSPSKTSPSPSPNPNLNPNSKLGIHSFEISILLSKLLTLHHSLSDSSIHHLKTTTIASQGLRKLVSNNDSFLLTLASAEFLQTLHLVSTSTSRFTSRYSTSTTLKSFPHSLHHFALSGLDPHHFTIHGKDLESLLRRADRLITSTSALYREFEELTSLENNAKKKSPLRDHTPDGLEIQQKIVWQRQQVKRVKDKSLWNRTFDSVLLLLVRLIFTNLARIKLLFGIGHSYSPSPAIPPLPRSLSASATVFPSSDLGNPNNPGPLVRQQTTHFSKVGLGEEGFFESKTKILKPPSKSLGAAALALHYSNLIIVLDKMIKAPHLVGLDAREDVYAMLPSSIRSSLRSRLKGVGFSATDPVLVGEWRDALARILAWLTPMAHNMIKWQNERSFEQHNLMAKSTQILLLQTLYFANQEKTEAAITELLVGLNYIWRFEREMNAKALLECSNNFFNNNNNNNNLQSLTL